MQTSRVVWKYQEQRKEEDHSQYGMQGCVNGHLGKTKDDEQ